VKLKPNQHKAALAALSERAPEAPFLQNGQLTGAAPSIPAKPRISTRRPVDLFVSIALR